MTRAVAKRLMLAMLLTIRFDFCGVSLVLAQGQKPNYLWEGWHKVPGPSHIQYKVFHDRVIALSNLSKGCDPGHPGSPFSFVGKIAKVNFDNQGLVVENFVLEGTDGDRSFINVDRISISAPGMDMADLGWIVQGLETLLRPDWYIQGSAFACGAAGRVLMLDKILASSIKPISSPPNTTALVPNKDVSEGQPQSQPSDVAFNLCIA